MLWIFSLNSLENTDENRIFFNPSPHHKHFGKLGALSTLLTSVVLYSSTPASLKVLGRTKHVLVDIYIYICLYIYIYIYT